MGSQSTYAPEQIDAIAGWLREGLSASQIADAFGQRFRDWISRNAVIGLVRRNKTLREIGFANKRSCAPQRRAWPNDGVSPDEVEFAAACRSIGMGEADVAQRLERRRDAVEAPVAKPVKRPKRKTARKISGRNMQGKKRCEIAARRQAGERVAARRLTRPVTAAATFLHAATEGLCLHYVGDPMSAGGPDMPVCGAPRDPAGPINNRYCCRHRKGGFEAVAVAPRLRRQKPSARLAA